MDNYPFRLDCNNMISPLISRNRVKMVDESPCNWYGIKCYRSKQKVDYWGIIDIIWLPNTPFDFPLSITNCSKNIGLECLSIACTHLEITSRQLVKYLKSGTININNGYIQDNWKLYKSGTKILIKMV